MYDRKQIVQTIRTLGEKGLHQGAIADELNKKGFTTMRGASWRQSSVSAFLQKPTFKRKKQRKTATSTVSMDDVLEIMTSNLDEALKIKTLRLLIK